MDEYLTIPEYCKLARMSRQTWYNHSKLGMTPPTIKLGSKVLIRRKTADAWLEAREGRAAA